MIVKAMKFNTGISARISMLPVDMLAGGSLHRNEWLSLTPCAMGTLSTLPTLAQKNAARCNQCPVR